MADHQSPCPRNMPSRVCTTHDLKRVKNLFKVMHTFKSSAVCKCRTRPWTRIVKCKGCQMIDHRRCLQNDETSSRVADEENGAAEEPTAEQPNRVAHCLLGVQCDDGAISTQLSATTTAASVTVRQTVDESTSEVACTRGVFVPPPNPSALPPLIPPVTPPYDLPSNIQITESMHFEGDVWFSMAAIQTGQRKAYNIITTTHLTDNVTLTAYLEVTNTSVSVLASSMVRTCAIETR